MENDKGKHLTLDDRKKIEDFIKDDEVFLKEIAISLNKDPRTISKEVYKHRVFEDRSNSREFNNVSLEKLDKCKRIIRFPYVCNGCKKRCFRNKYYYNANLAQKQYMKTLTECRKGIDLTSEEFKKVNEIIKDGTNKGQSICSILNNNSIQISQRTIYRYIDLNILDTKPMDLRNKVKLKKRKRSSLYHYKKTSEEREIYVGRSYADFLTYLATHNIYFVGQMDTVEGIKSDKLSILTLHSEKLHLMLMMLLPKHTSQCVVETLDTLERKMGPNVFNKIFPIILTDRGTEFMDVEGIEKSVFGGIRTKVFFCDPYSSSQKGAIESNHRLLRYFIPKHKSIEFLNEDKLLYIQNNIGNYTRKELGGSNPITLFTNIYGEEIATKIGLKKIDSSKVDLSMRSYQEKK